MNREAEDRFWLCQGVVIFIAYFSKINLHS